MLTVSRFYFDRAIEGHRRALDDLSVENIESVYMTSILVSFFAVFVLSEREEDSTLPSLDPLQWMRLAKGTRYICARWYELVSHRMSERPLLKQRAYKTPGWTILDSSGWGILWSPRPV